MAAQGHQGRVTIERIALDFERLFVSGNLSLLLSYALVVKKVWNRAFGECRRGRRNVEAARGRLCICGMDLTREGHAVSSETGG